MSEIEDTIYYDTVICCRIEVKRYEKLSYVKSGIAKILCAESEQWAKDKGCKKFASDCEITNEESLRFHLHMGFTEENRIICFRKDI